MGNRTVSVILNDLNVSTRDFMAAVVSAINNDNFFASRMLKKSKPFEGGNKIAVPLKYGREHTQTMGRYDEYNFQPIDILDEATYELKHVHGDMVIDEVRLEAQNKGKAADINLARTKSENMSESMKNEFSELLFKAVADLGTNDPDSLVKICATADNTVGAIDASTETRFSWNPQILDLSAEALTYADLVNPEHAYYIEKILRMIVGPLTVGNDKPTIGLCSQVIWDAYEEVLRADKRFDSMYKVADGGFETLRFRSMEIAVDSHVPGGKMNEVSDNGGMLLVINEKYMDYYHAPAMNFKWTPWKKAERQPVYFSMLDWVGALTTSRRDRQGAVLGLPTDEQVYG